MNIVHHPSNSIGHGVTSLRKYTLKKRAMARPNGIMQIGVHIIPNRNAQKGTPAQKHRTGRPRHPTLQDGRQLLYGWSVMAEQSPQMALRGEWQQLKNVPLSSWLIKNSLVQARNSTRCPRRKLLLTKNHRHSRLPLPREQRQQNESNFRSAIILIEIWGKDSSRKWGRSNGMGEKLPAYEL